MNPRKCDTFRPRERTRILSRAYAYSRGEASVIDPANRGVERRGAAAGSRFDGSNQAGIV